MFFKNFAEDSAGTPILTRRVFGNAKDAFRMDGNRRFSHDTNPNSHQWDDHTPSGITVELLNEITLNGAAVYTVKILIDRALIQDTQNKRQKASKKTQDSDYD